MSGEPSVCANLSPGDNQPDETEGQSSSSSPILGQATTRPSRQALAETTHLSHCYGCKTALKKCKGKSKTVATRSEADKYTQALHKSIPIGSVLCSRCRLKAYYTPVPQSFPGPPSERTPSLPPVPQSFPGPSSQRTPSSPPVPQSFPGPSSVTTVSSPPVLQGFPGPSSETTASSPPVLPGFHGQSSQTASSPVLGRSGPSGTSAMTREKCDICNTLLWKAGGRSKRIETKAEADSFSAAFGRSVVIGNVLCNKCRLKSYKKPADSTPAGVGSQSSHSSPSIGLSPDSGASSTSDPSFFVAEKSGGADEDKYAEMPLPRVVATHNYCFICGSVKDLTVVPFPTKQQVYLKRRIFVPKENRRCRSHLIKKKLYEDVLETITPYCHTSLIEVNDLNTNFLEFFTHRSEMTMADKVGDFTLAEEDVKVFTGLSWENLIELREMLHSMRDTQVRSKTEALVTFLFKMRTGNSNVMVASILGLERKQQVSEFCDSVLTSFEKDVLPQNFGVQALSREDIRHETSTLARKLLNITGQVALILDGTYVHHQKSGNNEYQRRSYSGQKKKPLCKPFTIATTNGFVVDAMGPFSANLNDAQILEEILKDESGLPKLLQPGDFIIVDRGFRDVVPRLQEAGYVVLMPALRGNRKQLTTDEANKSRKVTKIRWPVEAIHGIIGQKNKLLHHQVDNKLLPKVGSMCRIVCFINNKFGKRLESDKEDCDDILAQMETRDLQGNSLAQEVERKHLGRRRVVFTQIKASDVLDFPEMTEKDLKTLFTGTYQLSQSVSYLAEMMDSENNLKMAFLKENATILRAEVPSRHISSKVYKCFVDYAPDSIGSAGVRRYCCDCNNGNRTIGCCSHVAAIVYNRSHARYLSKIVRPAEILSKLFLRTQYMPAINEDSDDD